MKRLTKEYVKATIERIKAEKFLDLGINKVVKNNKVVDGILDDMESTPLVLTGPGGDFQRGYTPKI